jgi:hypothetical protein
LVGDPRRDAGSALVEQLSEMIIERARQLDGAGGEAEPDRVVGEEDVGDSQAGDAEERLREQHHQRAGYPVGHRQVRRVEDPVGKGAVGRDRSRHRGRVRRHVEPPGNVLGGQPGQEWSQIVRRSRPGVQPAVDVGLVAVGEIHGVGRQVAKEVVGDLELALRPIGPVLGQRLVSGPVAHAAEHDPAGIAAQRTPVLLGLGG